MSATNPALCVSIHDVSPHTWELCNRWVQAIHAVAPIPISFLLVPFYHRREVAASPDYFSCLEHRLAQGDELVLHGYTHLDENPPGRGYANYFIRHIYSQSEAEFFDIGAASARMRIEAGLDWFARNHWPVHGFVAPCWLLGKEAKKVIREFPFIYTTTQRRFHLLDNQDSLFSPSLVYSIRSSWRRLLWRTWTALLCEALNSKAQLVRFSLHPVDACYPEIITHTQNLIEALVKNRKAMTKVAFARSWQSVLCSNRPYTARFP